MIWNDKSHKEHSIMRSLLLTAVPILLIAGASVPCHAQTNAELFNYLKQDLNLSQDQIAAIQRGEPVALNAASRQPAEVFVFGAVYVKAPPERYVKLAYDFDRLRKIPEYLAIEPFGNPPQLSDLKSFS